MKEQTKTIAKHVLTETLKCILIGVSVGVLIALYKYAASYVTKASKFLFDYNSLENLGVGLICVIPILFIVYFLLKSEGSIQGSGMPQLLLNEENKKGNIKWYRAMPKMFVSSLMSFFVGVPLGSEAPSTFMSGTIGLAYRNLFKHDDDDDDVEIASGAGFGAVFLSPLSGICYAIEEGHTKKTPLKFYKAIITSIVAFIISYLINPNFLIFIPLDEGFNWENSYYLPIILGFCGVFALLLTYGTRYVKQFINKHYKNFFIKNRMFFVYLFSVIILIAYPILAGSGHDIIDLLIEGNMYSTFWWLILIYLIYRILMFLIVGNSMLSGGNMLPTLAIGALIGELIYMMLSNIPNFDTTQHVLIIVLSMFTLFAFVYKLPITSFVLILSTGGINGLATTFIPAFILMTFVYLIMKIVNTEDVNEVLKDLLRTSKNS